MKADCLIANLGFILLKNYIFIVVFFLGKASASEDLRGVGGSLLFENRLNEGFQHIVFKTPFGKTFAPFDTGFLFYYSLESLSPDKTKSVVQFSGQGILEDATGVPIEERSIYMCAFIRMTDGCIAHVAEGEICGGGWNDQVTGPLPHMLMVKIFSTIAPASARFTNNTWRKNTQPGSEVRLYSLLQEGTSIENIFACDPLQDNNRTVYFKLLEALQVDGDLSEAGKLERFLN
ncbi:hypothetical protein [Pseudomonas tohonis]|uniref:hypothetical protein n=1 Tax=Pseudomonas tohonis TaxID=2725477 RepID=UPI00255BB4C5|nr:hypothetical protein [Pseudomonas tohonis]